jgi:TetR/AcrR family transcriptional regulator
MRKESIASKASRNPKSAKKQEVGAPVVGAKATQPAKSAQKRKVGRPPIARSTGRPKRDTATVGRDMLIDVTCELLKTTQPAEISRALVARKTGVDPSLIRYYFSNRSTLLIAAAQRVTEKYAEMVEEATSRSDGSPQGLLFERIRALIDLLATYPYFHRLLTEEIMPSNTVEARAMFGAVTERGSLSYDAILRKGIRQGVFRDVDRSFLFAAIIGMSEFYVPGRRVIEEASGRPIPESELRAAYTKFIFDLIMRGIGR